MQINLLYSFLEILTLLSILSALAVITSTNAVLSIIYLIVVFINAAVYLILVGLGFIGISYIIVYIGAITVLFLFIIMMISTDILETVEVGSEYGKTLPLAYTIAVFFLILFIMIIPPFLNGLSDYETLFYFSQNNTWSSLLTPIGEYAAYSQLTNYVDVAEASNASTAPIINNISILPVLNKDLTSLLSYDSFLSTILQIETIGQAIYGYASFILVLISYLLLLAMISAILLTRLNKEINNS